jgi:hypothetical protein
MPIADIADATAVVTSASRGFGRDIAATPTTQVRGINR